MFTKRTTPKYKHILLEETPGGGYTMTNKVYEVMRIDGPALTRDRRGRRIAARLEGIKKFLFSVKRENYSRNGDLIQLLFSDGVYWRVGYATFYNSDYSFSMMLHEVHEGPGTGIIAVEFIGERPGYTDYQHRRVSIDAATRRFQQEEEEREEDY